MLKQNNTSPYKKFIDFIEKYRCQTNSLDKQFTHTTMGYPKGSFNIPDNKSNMFFDLYEKALKSGEFIYMTEAHLSQGPIIIDIDIKYLLNYNNEKTRLYTEQHILDILKIYNNTILEYLDVEEENFRIYILEKNKASFVKDILEDGEIKKQYKDGVHIIYPFICATNQCQHLIREYAMNEIKKRNILEEIPIINTYEDIFDKAIIDKNNWLLYGSGKNDNKDSIYGLSKIYNYDLELLNDDLIDINHDTLPRNLSIRKFTSDDLTDYKANYNNDIINQQYTALINKKRTNNNNKNFAHLMNEKDVNRARILCDMLSNDRLDNFDSWIELGFCLHNIDDSLLDVWIELSRKSPKFQEGDCEKRWSNFKKDGLGIGSLYRWARLDNPEQYANFLMSEFDDLIMKSLNGTSHAVAKVFYEMNKYCFVCESIKNKSFFEFKDHRWQRMDEATGIIKKLNEDMSDTYGKFSIALITKAMASQDIKEKEDLMKKQKKAVDISLKLNRMSFKREVIAELYHMYYDNKFAEKLDENRNLICFLNGVYDLSKFIFRDGRPEDYISKCTQLNYLSYDSNNQQIKEVEKFFSDIQPNEENRNYLLGFLSSMLDGHQRYQKFPIWTGTGANGKGRISKLILDSFGDYATTCNVTFLTTKKTNSSGPSPELAKTKGSRALIFQEPEDKDKIYVGNMKSLVGGDKLEARGLYSAPIEFYPQFKTILACNKLPEIPSNDGGTWRRIRVLSFDVKFVSNPNPNNPNEKKANNDIDEVIAFWREAFMSILIKRYKDYRLHGLYEPESVLAVTRKYQYNSDMFAEYIQESLRITNNDNDAVNVKDLFEDFKFWHKEAKQYAPKMDRNNFISEIEDKIGKMCGQEFLGIQLRTIDDHPNFSVTDSEAKINSTIDTDKFNQLNKFKSNITNTTDDNIEIKSIINDTDTTLTDTLQLKSIFLDNSSQLKSSIKKSNKDTSNLTVKLSNLDL